MAVVYTKKMVYRKSVFVVVYRKENSGLYYLLLKRKLHWRGWEFPKGGIEKKENLIKAVKRECFEETGQRPVKINELNFSGRYRYHKTLKDRPGITGQHYTSFACEIKNKKVTISKIEHSGYKWTSYENALKSLKWQNQKKALKIAEKIVR